MEEIISAQEENLASEVLSYAEITDTWNGTKHNYDWDAYVIMDLVNDLATHVAEEEFDGGMPGTSFNRQVVYANDPESFKKKLNEALTNILKENLGGDS